jgi:LysR family transcriptional regulator, carnitine catabolism transcriptional activator
MIDFSSRQLRAFLLVAEHRSFTRAASALFITPSGLSVMIKELEGQLGFRLFDRTTRQVGLTPHGRQLLAVARRSLDEIDAATARIARLSLESSDTLSVGSGLLVSANILPPAIKQFRSRRPEVQIRLVDADPTTVRTPFFQFSLMVARPEVPGRPAGSRTGVRPGSDPIADAEATRVKSARSRTGVRPASDPFADGDATRVTPRGSTTWSALKNERLIAQVPTNSVQQLINRQLARAGVTAPPALVLNRLDTILAMVEAGEGIAVVPSYALPACRYRHVVMSHLTNPRVTLDFHQIRHRGRKLPPAADDFTAFLQNYIAGWAGRAGVL